MLRLAIIFLVISLVAGALGFVGLSEAAGRIAKILFAIFLVLAIAVVAVGLLFGAIVF